MRRRSTLTASKRRRNTSQRRRFRIEALESRQLMAVVLADFNNDGFDDMATGVPGENINYADEGAVNVIYGSAGGLTAAGDQFWTQDSPGIAGKGELSDRFGSAVAAGDFNNDGYDDLAIGVPGEDIGDIENAGAINVLYGSPNGLTAAGSQGLHQDSPGIQGVAEAFDQFGLVLSSGDYNGDGYYDLAIGVPHENVGDKQDAGAVQVIYGSTSGLTDQGDQLLFQGGAINGVTIQGAGAAHHDLFGASLTTGNFNGDINPATGRAVDDLAIGVPGEDLPMLYDIGAVNVIYGSANRLVGSGNRVYFQASLGVPGAPEAWDNFGSALAAGDFDADGYSDLAIGTPNEDIGSVEDAGAVHIMYGRSSYGFETNSVDMWNQDSTGVQGNAEPFDYFGASLIAGDFNGDGKDDLVIGAPGEDVNSEKKFDGGVVHLLYGLTSGLAYYQNRLYYQGDSGVGGAHESYDYFGSALAAGDTNGDGITDLAVAAAGEAVGSNNWAGAVSVLQGKSTYGLRTDNDRLWYQDTPGVIGGSESNDYFGGLRPASMSRTGVPMLQSNPGASKQLFLDFTGGSSLGESIPAFTMDGRSSFNYTERSMIVDIWSYVAEDYAPFDINVTTSPLGAGEQFRVLIGGNGSNLQDDPTSGWGPGDFTDAFNFNNDVYVYSARIQSWVNPGANLAAQIGTTASHEAGHGFGLDHKSSTIGGLVYDEYSDGDSDWTPIMGGNLATDRTIWTQSKVLLDPVIPGMTSYAVGDNDFSHLKDEIGLRSDDHWGAFSLATDLGSLSTGGMRRDTGLIRSNNDKDMFKFAVTSLANYKITVSVADVGANLDSRLTLFDASGNQVTATDTGLGSAITSELVPGTYYAEVSSQGTLTGDVGQYTLRAAWDSSFFNPFSTTSSTKLVYKDDDSNPALTERQPSQEAEIMALQDAPPATDLALAEVDQRAGATKRGQAARLTGENSEAQDSLFEELGARRFNLAPAGMMV